MASSWSWLVVASVIVAGCAAPEESPATGPDVAPPGGDAEATGPGAPGAVVEGDEDTAQPPPTRFDAALDGRLSPGTRVCRPSTGECTTARPTADDQELFLADLSGTLVAGFANLTWTPSSDLTRELRLTVFWVPACETCELVFVGGTIATGPIEVALEAPQMLDGGSLWAYVRAPYANNVDDVYVQQDFEQTFRLELVAFVEPTIA